MSETQTPPVIDASEMTSLEPMRRDGFSRSEREEIIYRLQAVENVCETLSIQLNDMIGELFPLNDREDGTMPQKVNMVREIHMFCVRLAGVLDSMGANPMVAAMMPPGTFGDSE